MLQADDARRPVNGRGRADVMVVVLDDLGLLSEDEAEGAPYVADVQRLVIGIEQQYRAIHDSLRSAGTRPRPRLHRSKSERERRAATIVSSEHDAMKNSQQSADPPLQPDTDDDSHAEFGTTSRSRSWLWPAAALVVILVVVVVIGRLGQTPGESLPASSPVPPRAVVPERSLTIVANPGASSSSGLPSYRIGIRSDGQRYDDGIPANLDGNQVVR